MILRKKNKCCNFTVKQIGRASQRTTSIITSRIFVPGLCRDNKTGESNVNSNWRAYYFTVEPLRAHIFVTRSTLMLKESPGRACGVIAAARGRLEFLFGKFRSRRSRNENVCLFSDVGNSGSSSKIFKCTFTTNTPSWSCYGVLNRLEIYTSLHFVQSIGVGVYCCEIR